jgi:hypothetical protein
MTFRCDKYAIVRDDDIVTHRAGTVVAFDLQSASSYEFLPWKFLSVEWKDLCQFPRAINLWDGNNFKERSIQEGAVPAQPGSETNNLNSHQKRGRPTSVQNNQDSSGVVIKKGMYSLYYIVYSTTLNPFVPMHGCYLSLFSYRQRKTAAICKTSYVKRTS